MADLDMPPLAKNSGAVGFGASKNMLADVHSGTMVYDASPQSQSDWIDPPTLRMLRELEAQQRMIASVYGEQSFIRKPAHLVAPPPQVVEFEPLTVKGFHVASIAGDARTRSTPVDNVPAKAETPQEVERRLIATFEKQTPLEQMLTVLARMPERASLHVDGKKLTVETNFGRTLEAIPGVQLDGNAWLTLNSLKSVSLEGDRFTAELASPTLIKGFELNVQGFKLGELSIGDIRDPRLTFDVSFDAKTGTAALTDIKGLNVSTAGGFFKLPITKIELGNKDGKQQLTITMKIGNREIAYDMLSQQAFPGIDATVFRNTVGTFSDLKSVLNKRDLGPFANRIAEVGLRDAVKSLVKGVVSIEKNGDQIAIKRDNGALTYDANGAKVIVFGDFRFKFNCDPEKPCLTEMQGVAVSLPLPEEMRLGSRYVTNIKGLSLGAADSNGARKFTIAANDMMDRLQMTVDKNLHTLADEHGNYVIDLHGANPISDRRTDKMDVRLRFDKSGSLNLTAAEVTDVISRMSWQASDLSFGGAGLAIIAGSTKVASWAASAYHWLFD